MRAIFRRELSSYLNNLSGYVFGAFLLLFAGIFCMVYNLQSALAAFEYVVSSMCFVFLVIVPVLTMRVLAEERRQKTDQLLYSLPLTMTQVVLGKYLAMMVIFLLPLAVISLYPLVLSLFGNVYLPAAYSALAGFFCLGAALIAIGTYVSSVTESQAVAAGLCFVVMLINFYVADLANYLPATAISSFTVFFLLALLAGLVVHLMTKNSTVGLTVAALLSVVNGVFYWMDSTAYEGLFPTVMAQLSLFSRLYDMLNGVFDLKSIVYFASVTGVFLFLSVQSMEKRRWSE